MDWFNVLLSILGIIFGGGVTWLFTVNSMKKKADGEATQSQAEGWKAQQDVYQQTIEDLKQSCEYIKNDRNLLREENATLRAANEEWRNKYRELEEQFVEFKKQQVDEMNKMRAELARQGRKLEGVLPFTCGLAGCAKRTRVEIQDQTTTEEEE